MEYFAACYIVRQCDSATELTDRIKPIIVSGASDVVPQIAIQQFDLRRANGINECVALLVFDAPRGTAAAERRTYLEFALRSLRFMRPSPTVLHRLYLEALRAFGETVDLPLLGLLLQGPPEAQEQLALAWQSAIDDTTTDPPLRLGSALARILAPVHDVTAALTDADYVHHTIFANEDELRRIARLAPDVITEMRRRRLIATSHNID